MSRDSTPLFNPTEFGQTIEIVFPPYGDKGWNEKPREDRRGNEFLACKIRVQGARQEMKWLVYEPELSTMRDLNPQSGDKLRVQVEEDGSTFIELESRGEGKSRGGGGGGGGRRYGGAGGARRGGGGGYGKTDQLTTEDIASGIDVYMTLYRIMEAQGVRAEHWAQAAATHFIRWDKGGRPQPPTVAEFENGDDGNTPF